MHRMLLAAAATVLWLAAWTPAGLAGGGRYPWLPDAGHRAADSSEVRAAHSPEAGTATHTGPSDPESGAQGPCSTLETRIPPPAGFHRVPVEPGGLRAWLRGLPLKPEGSPVRLYDGSRKQRQDVHAAVVDLDVAGRDQQCADALIRLWAEYLWSVGKADEICFRFTSGDPCCWKRWRRGWRPVVQGSAVRWRRSGAGDGSRRAFFGYLKTVFAYAGTASLERELQPVSEGELKAGDAVVEGGFPGHAVLVLDLAVDRAGHRMMLLGQSYMPAQEFHVLRNPARPDSPWYDADFGSSLATPEWFFAHPRCRRFKPAGP